MLLCYTLECMLAFFSNLCMLLSSFLVTGASSWYDAFLTNEGGKCRVYKEVLHLIRNPINVIESRSFRLAIDSLLQRKHLRHVAGQWEDVGDLFPVNSTLHDDITYDNDIKFALKHWVRRNSFVHQTASWVEQTEQLSTEPLAAWRMCMAAGFGPRCPGLDHWRNVIEHMGNHTNTDTGNATGKMTSVDRRKVEWSTLLQLEPMYASIAMKMSLEFGYHIPYEYLYDNALYGNISTIQYQCGFDPNQKWDCWI
jgi:hypothetical protein